MSDNQKQTGFKGWRTEHVELLDVEAAYAELPLAYAGSTPLDIKTLIYRFSYKEGGAFIVTRGPAKALVTTDAAQAVEYYNTGVWPEGIENPNAQNGNAVGTGA